MKPHWPAVLFGSLLAAAAQAQDLQLRLGVWQMTPEGSGAVGFNGAKGTPFDLQDDLGYGAEEDVLAVDLVAGYRHQVAVSWLQFDLSARQAITQQLRFSDVIYSVDSEIRTDIEANLLRGGYRYNGGADNLHGGYLIGLQYADLSARASEPYSGSARGSVEVVLPAIGVHGSFAPVDLLQLQGSLVGGAWDWDEVSATFVDAEIMALLRLPYLVAGLGYRYLSVDGSDDSIPIEADVSFAGPILFAGCFF